MPDRFVRMRTISIISERKTCPKIRRSKAFQTLTPCGNQRCVVAVQTKFLDQELHNVCFFFFQRWRYCNFCLSEKLDGIPSSRGASRAAGGGLYEPVWVRRHHAVLPGKHILLAPLHPGLTRNSQVESKLVLSGDTSHPGVHDSYQTYVWETGYKLLGWAAEIKITRATWRRFELIFKDAMAEVAHAINYIQHKNMMANDRCLLFQQIYKLSTNTLSLKRRKNVNVGCQ